MAKRHPNGFVVLDRSIAIMHTFRSAVQENIISGEWQQACRVPIVRFARSSIRKLTVCYRPKSGHWIIRLWMFKQGTFLKISSPAAEPNSDGNCFER
jgi:hypothetical protein